MAQYHIYQSNNPTFDETVKQYRVYVGFVEADTLNEAYALSQNSDKPWNEAHPCRSTSVGDIIQGPDGFHLVLGMGFKKLD
jgi:hypothetical protein